MALVRRRPPVPRIYIPPLRAPLCEAREVQRLRDEDCDEYQHLQWKAQ
jgi:hypothetical protein